MKLSHLALFLTACLLAVTAYLSLQSRESWSQKLEDIEAQVAANKDEAEEKKSEMEKMLEAEKKANDLLKMENDKILAELKKKDDEAKAALAESEIVAGGASKAIAAAAGGEPEELTPQQQKIKEAQSIGEVMAYDENFGFVVLNCGTGRGITPGMKFVVRRNYFVVGKVQVDSVEEDEAIANLVKGSIPIGFTIQKGDAVIMAEDVGLF